MNRGGRRDVKREKRSRSRSPRRNRPVGGASGNDRMVFITNIPYEVRWVELKNLVREKGGEVVFVELLEDRNGKPKGNAVVEFETRASAENCVTNLSKFEFKGRSLIVKEIRDPVAFFRGIKNETGIDYLARTGGGGAPRSGKEPIERAARSGTYELFGLNMDFLRQLNIEPPLCERIFVANLAFNVGTDKIYEVFGMAGKITWLDFRIDKEGKTKGACVIQYSHPIEAVQAVSMFHGQRLYDRSLIVKMDQFEKIETDKKEGGLPRGLDSIGMGLGADGAPLANVSAVFGSGGGSVAEPLQPFSAPTSAPFMSGGFGSGGNGMSANSFTQSVLGNQSYGGPAFPADTSGFGGHPSRMIVIRNLPNDYTWQIVRDRVRQFGDVEAVDIVSPGAARVRFSNIPDAERARTALFGTTVEGRVINVEYV
ncbi:unnamed protein product [Caenorhabditis bovis]|uniref:RRM domain-containing protein n=1 Tax=Caenorhabditis bovis TaxID=2654633 RepID=A0A8S1FAG4_9PELO|nr:unnamed protein product [Caenorhabditis bovis]